MVDTTQDAVATGVIPQRAPAIQVSEVVKSFGERPILRKLDLNVNWNDRYILFGANGSGKTTLMKLLAGLARTDEGSIHIAGLDARRQGATLRRYVGVVTHQPLLYEDLSGLENLRFYGRMYRVPDLQRRIQTVTEQLDAARYLSSRVRILSHGMKKRLSIARALLHDPPILLLDEPETGLDEEALGLLDAVLLSQSDASKTVLMTTHSLERGLALGNRIGVLAGGRIVYEDMRASLNIAKLREVFRMHLEPAP